MSDITFDSPLTFQINGSSKQIKNLSEYIDLIFETIGVHNQSKDRIKSVILKLNNSDKYKFINNNILKEMIQKLLDIDSKIKLIYDTNKSNFNSKTANKWNIFIDTISEIQIYVSIMQIVNQTNISEVFINAANEKMAIINELFQKKLEAENTTNKQKKYYHYKIKYLKYKNKYLNLL